MNVVRPIIAIAGLSMLLAACGGALPTETSGPGGGSTPGASTPTPVPTVTPEPTATPTPSTGPTVEPTPTPGTPEWEYEVVPAPIESVDIRVAESAPPQYFADIVSGLPSGCARYNGYEMEREGNTIKITVTNTMPKGPDIACTMIYGMHEESVPLGSDFESGETYTVIVNDDKSASFVAQ